MSREEFMRTLFLFCIANALLTAVACYGLVTQEKTPQPGTPPAQRETGEERAFGTVASVGIDRFELKKMDGSAQTVLVDDRTHYRQGQQDIQLEDLKPGDRVVVRGRTSPQKEFVATLVRRMTEEEIGRFQNAGERVFGEIVSIEGNQLKVRSPRQGERIVLVNEQTVLKKQGDPITLKDLKVGDRIFALGKETEGKLTATQIFTGQFRGEGQERGRQEH
jgi:uncharacterized protein DUF5666